MGRILEGTSSMRWCDDIKLLSARGLGLVGLELQNWTLLTKRWWRFKEKKDALWRKVVVSKCGEAS